ncbi:MAG TPA: 50S ribosomal protein L29 [Candidatus Ratteibacteria bacterium]|jgi:large subunit ribosomal protein L29|uniref:Large ribosomal subunit protein uL29 n=1 Tax=candidate division TA06 bacterium ADurb.Bin131 TaxID=1852827 RepID=A0A1V6C4K0_UNCT6|nr:MAG: 50S ribosomal protein L29 [candidate division TA06 bacterium ADurb.Bin131]HOC03022.1 50S ribosomal protein L29 [bacterium]HON04871.1 50S ribosomal protein L29 [bacterium]HPC29459.1 50S ribosomal protein L29 [bacterium]HRS07116.1 50S ribosomal protein L29 [Candidatus Ratteibacteria bacterium]
MKKQDFDELKELSIQELEQKRMEVAKRLFDQRVQVRLGQMKNVRILRNLRKDIAQLNTLIQQKRMKNQRGTNGAK